jgi:hypothetical protein
MIDAMRQPGRNDACYCGSGQKYKKCHLELFENEPKWRDWARTSKLLYEKNMALLAATKEIFHLERPWDQVKAGMSDARIRAFYEFVGELWPPDTAMQVGLPAPETNLRALYLGENLPELMLDNVFRFSLYADEIVLVNPFEIPHMFREEYNPIVHPEQWRIQTLRVVYQLLMLAPWVAAGIVILIPNPGDFNIPFLMKTAEMAKARLGENFVSQEDIEELSYAEVMRKQLYLAPPDYLAHKVRELNPGISDEEVQKLLEYVALERKNDPLLVNDTLDKMPGQMTTMKSGASLEMGLFICQHIGAFPYTNLKLRWKEILSAGSELDPKAQVWSPLTKAFQELDFKFLNRIDSKFAVEIREEGRLSGFRSYLRKIWTTVEGDIDLSKAEMYASDFKDELAGEYDKAKAEWESIDRKLMNWAVPAIAGALGAIGSVVTGHLGLSIPTGGFAMKGVNELIQAHFTRSEFRKKTPMSVFIDLDRKK